MSFFENEEERRDRLEDRRNTRAVGKLIGYSLFVLIFWYLIRLLLRLISNTVNFILTLVSHYYVYLIVMAIGLLLYSIINTIIGRKPWVKVIPLVGGIFILGCSYWGYLTSSLPKELIGSYIRKDKKARLTIQGDSIHIWSGNTHLKGSCEFIPFFSITSINARITGFPSSLPDGALFSTSVDEMFGETVYTFRPTVDSLIIYHPYSPIVRYVRVK